MVQALGAAAAVLAIAGFIWFMDAIGKEWSRRIDVWPADEDDLAAEALVPGYAAERRFRRPPAAPDYAGPCRCIACRKRTSEPCSDYDGV